MLGIVVSEADEASVHIGEQLRTLTEWTERTDPDCSSEQVQETYWTTDGATIRRVEELHLATENAASLFADPTLIVFVSRHSGDTGPLLSAHFTGNLGPAEFGGSPGQLAAAAPGAGDRALAELRKHAPSEYDVSMECTHHGPSTVGVPSLFVELGSGPTEWTDSAGATAVAKATLELRDVDPCPERTVACIGGGHYAPRATRIAAQTDWAVGHIAADWALEEATQPLTETLDLILTRSGTTRAIVEGDRPSVVSALEKQGYSIVSETWLQETTGVPLERVRELEGALCAVSEGLRFGTAARSSRSWTRRTLPDELLEACQAAEAPATVDIVADHTVAYETVEAGNRVEGEAAFPTRAAYDAMIDDLVSLLESHHDDVRRTEGAVQVTDTVFDPEAARTLGVPEGPAFGRLAAGEDVEVDGQMIPASAVRTEETRQFPV